MQVEKLEGAELDAWVAKAEGLELRPHAMSRTSLWWYRGPLAVQHVDYFRPSVNWQQAGPIIERERITVQASQAGDWRAYMSNGVYADAIQSRGDSPLIAAMRAYVASKFGDEVPDAKVVRHA